MDKWTELKTAYHVARLGTISGAARYLDIHRATVLRHIDALEQAIGQKLFIRNRKGYVPTDMGNEVLRIGSETEEKISDLIGVQNRKHNEVCGELIITSVDLVIPLLMPAVRAYQLLHPNVTVKCMPDIAKYNLEYGEAHIAIRSGQPPDIQDYVVKKFCKFRFGLYAHKGYVAEFGAPKDETDFDGHRFVGLPKEAKCCAFDFWLQEHVPEAQYSFMSSCHQTCDQAMMQGQGIGFYSVEMANEAPQLIEILPARDCWDIQFWWLSHGDMHRTDKVQSFMSLLRDPKNQPTRLQKIFNM